MAGCCWGLPAWTTTTLVRREKPATSVNLEASAACSTGPGRASDVEEEILRRPVNPRRLFASGILPLGRSVFSLRFLALQALRELVLWVQAERFRQLLQRVPEKKN